MATRDSKAKRKQVQRGRVEAAKQGQGYENVIPYQSSVQRFKRSPWWRVGDPKNWPKQ